MPELPASSSSPLAFSSADGAYFLIPLNAVYFDASGEVKADRWPLYATHKAVVDPLLVQLRTTGVLAPGPEPPRRPALVATAKTAGATGIAVTLDISNVSAKEPPASSTADVTVTEHDSYVGLSADKLVETIGAAANGGSHPGSVFVSSSAAPGLPKAGHYPMAAPAAGDLATVDIPTATGAGTAFTLKTRTGTADALLVAIDISDVDTTHTVFTLLVAWTKTATAIALSDLDTSFDYVIDVKAPASGFLAPAEGSSTLSGGSDSLTVSPIKASAVISAK